MAALEEFDEFDMSPQARLSRALAYQPIERPLQAINEPVRQNTGWLDDAKTALGYGVQTTPDTLSHMVDVPVSLVTGKNLVSHAADWVSKDTAFDFDKKAEQTQKKYSPERQRFLKSLEGAGGFEQLRKYVMNPDQALVTGLESVPSMLTTDALLGLAARAAGTGNLPAAGGAGLLALASWALRNPAARGAVAEAGISGGQQLSSYEKQGIEGRGAALNAGVVGAVDGLIGFKMGKLANDAGLIDPDTLMAKVLGGGNVTSGSPRAAGVGTSLLDRANRVAGSYVFEGLEEAFQSGTEELATNIAEGKPYTEWLDNVPGAMGAGFGIGGAMGGFAGAITPAQKPDAPRAPTFDELKSQPSVRDTFVNNITPDTSTQDPLTYTDLVRPQTVSKQKADELSKMWFSTTRDELEAKLREFGMARKDGSLNKNAENILNQFDNSRPQPGFTPQQPAEESSQDTGESPQATEESPQDTGESPQSAEETLTPKPESKLSKDVLKSMDETSDPSPQDDKIMKMLVSDEAKGFDPLETADVDVDKDDPNTQAFLQRKAEFASANPQAKGVTIELPTVKGLSLAYQGYLPESVERLDGNKVGGVSAAKRKANRASKLLTNAGLADTMPIFRRLHKLSQVYDGSIQSITNTLRNMPTDKGNVSFGTAKGGPTIDIDKDSRDRADNTTIKGKAYQKLNKENTAKEVSAARHAVGDPDGLETLLAIGEDETALDLVGDPKRMAHTLGVNAVLKEIEDEFFKLEKMIGRDNLRAAMRLSKLIAHNTTRKSDAFSNVYGETSEAIRFSQLYNKFSSGTLYAHGYMSNTIRNENQAQTRVSDKVIKGNLKEAGFTRYAKGVDPDRTKNEGSPLKLGKIIESRVAASKKLGKEKGPGEVLLDYVSQTNPSMVARLLASRIRKILSAKDPNDPKALSHLDKMTIWVHPKNVGENGMGGGYDRYNNAIVLYNNTSVEVILHEFLHAATTVYIRENPNSKAVKSLQKLQDVMVALLDDPNAKLSKRQLQLLKIMKGKGIPTEFVSYGFTESEFVSLMRKTKAVDAKGNPIVRGLKNVWEVFTQTLRAMFGLNTVNRSALDQFLVASGSLMGEIYDESRSNPGMFMPTVPLKADTGMEARINPQGMIDIDGVSRWAVNSEGKPIANTEEGIRNFWAWFKDSKVVDKEGRPLVVYHGTDKDFNAFDRRKHGSKDHGWYGVGHYFTPHTDTASAYADYGNEYDPRAKYSSSAPVVMPVYLSIQNPFIWDNTMSAAKSLDEAKMITKSLTDLGYDGVFASNKYFTGENSDKYEIVVFKGTQAKSSTGNNGNFDPKDDGIDYASTPEKEEPFDPTTDAKNPNAKQNKESVNKANAEHADVIKANKAADKAAAMSARREFAEKSREAAVRLEALQEGSVIQPYENSRDVTAVDRVERAMLDNLLGMIGKEQDFEKVTSEASGETIKKATGAIDERDTVLKRLLSLIVRNTADKYGTSEGFKDIIFTMRNALGRQIEAPQVSAVTLQSLGPESQQAVLDYLEHKDQEKLRKIVAVPEHVKHVIKLVQIVEDAFTRLKAYGFIDPKHADKPLIEYIRTLDKSGVPYGGTRTFGDVTPATKNSLQVNTNPVPVTNIINAKGEFATDQTTGSFYRAYDGYQVYYVHTLAPKSVWEGFKLTPDPDAPNRKYKLKGKENAYGERVLSRVKTFTELQKENKNANLINSLAYVAQAWGQRVEHSKYFDSMLLHNESLPDEDKWIREDRPKQGEVFDMSDPDTKADKKVKSLMRAPGTWVKVENNANTFGDLANKYVAGPVYAALEDMQGYKPIIDSITYRWANMVYKKFKTVLNPPTHMVNIGSNFISAYYEDIPLRNIQRAFRTIVEANYPKVFDKLGIEPGEPGLLDEFKDMGGTLGSYKDYEFDTEMTNIVKELYRDADDSSKSLFKAVTLMDHFFNVLLKSDELAGQLYSDQDNVFRLATYITMMENQLAAEQKANPGKKPVATKAMKDKAARRAADAFVNYDIYAPWVRTAKELSLPFISWSYRWYPKLARIAVTKPWKLINTVVTLSAMASLFLALAGVSSDEDDEERKNLPDYMQNHLWGIPGVDQYIRLPFGGEGKANYYNISRLIPLGDMFNTDKVTGLPTGLVPSGPHLSTAFGLFDYDVFKGTRLSSPEATPLESVGNRAAYIAKQLGPGILNPIEDLWEIGVNDKRGPLQREASAWVPLAGLFGFNITQIDSAEQKYNHQKQMQRIQREFATMRNSIIRHELRYGTPDVQDMEDKLLNLYERERERLDEEINNE